MSARPSRSTADLAGQTRRAPHDAGRHVVVALVLGILLAAPPPLAAQRILGGGSDAVTLPRGAFRVGVGGESTVQRDRWRDGVLEGLGGDRTTDAFGPLQFSLLSTVETRMAELGVSGFEASLGNTRLDARQRAFVTPLSVEYGLAEWLTLGARASLVRTKAESQFRIRTDSGRATLGVNPKFLGSGVASQNDAITLAYASAVLGLGARRDACQANAGSHPSCPTVLAELASVNALVGRAGTFLLALAQLYGNLAVRGSRYVPFEGSSADSGLTARADSIRTAFERYGITDVTASTGLPLGAQVALAGEDLDRLVRDSTDGYGARALNDAALTQVGDVYVSALMRVHDGFAPRGPAARFARGARGWRQSILIEGRVGTSHRERADAFLDQGTGSGTSAITARSITDAVLTDQIWTTVAVGVTKGFARDAVVRLPSSTDANPGAEWLEAWRERTVPVTPGAQLDVEVAPRWVVNDYVALGLQWRWRRKAADRHEWDESFGLVPDGRSIRLLGSLLDDRTAAEEQRVGLTATYSTLAARMRGLRGLAFEISYAHQQSVASGTGIVPKQWEDRLVIRYYTRFRPR